MRQLFITTLAALAIASCGDKQATVPADQVKRERDSLQAIIDDKSNELNDFMGTFAEIQQGLQQINEAEGRVTVANGNLECATSMDIIRDNMAFMREALQQRREQIIQLKNKLKTSSLNVEKMQAALDNLQKQLDEQSERMQELQVLLAERDELIAQQGATIASQDEAINKLGQENEQKAQTVAAQDKQLNEAWYVFGTKMELKAQKIIDEGKVLSSGNFNKDYLTKIDIRQTKEIRLFSKNAQFMTSHPDGSYQLVKDGKGEYTLKITNPSKFWNLSRYLVIQVK